MKKLFITIAILTGMTLSASAQFYRGAIYQRTASGTRLSPSATTLSSGIAVLAALGGAYLLRKRKKE